MIQVEIKKAANVNGDQNAFLSFPYDTKLVEYVRGLPSRNWNPTAKQWEIPLNRLPEFINLAADQKITIKMIQEADKPDPMLPKGFRFKTTPYDHQKVGLMYGLKYDRFLLGDEQGLGKTKQVIDIAVVKRLQFGYKHCLIICGVNGNKWNWKSEIELHSDLSGHILGSSQRSNGRWVVGSSSDKLADLENLPKDYFLITNVESLRYHVGKKAKGKKSQYPILEKIKELCEKGEIEMIAIDEIHKCKNPSSQQGQAILDTDAKVKIAMTGTAIMNNPLDSYIVWKWLGYEKHSFFQFKVHYCVMGGFGGYEVVGYKNLNELRSLFEDHQLRRLKKEAMDLPDKIHTVEYVEMEPKQAKIYAEVKSEIKQNIDKIKISNNPLAQLIRLRQATGYTGILSNSVQLSAKLDRLEELVEEAVGNGEKVLVFSNWTDMTHPTMDRLAAYNPAVITGEVGEIEREAQKNRFQTDPNCKVIVGTIGAMGTGITLTAGTTVIFLDSPWNRALKEQAEDRAHRIGTKSNVSVITLVCKDTIDERIEELIEKKGAIADALVDGKINGQKAETLDFLLS